uniref:30S ribosomal protein S1 n=1 Tax=Haramonas pauciplastida TaxID=478668 RepID=UPI0021159A55|nr:30S ribosomal protein S1 [Haramonas pauciplastida]UTE94944.1 30S ribosomal protein S1 [Haramonas pauciplastida]
MAINFTRVIKASLFISIIRRYDYRFSWHTRLGGQIISIERAGLLVDIGSKILAYLPCEELFEIRLLRKKTRKFLYSTLLRPQRLEIGNFLLIRCNKQNSHITISLKKYRSLLFWKRLNTVIDENLNIWGRVYKSVDRGKLILIQQGLNISSRSLRSFLYNFQLPKYYRRKDRKNFSIPVKLVKMSKQKNRISLTCYLACFENQIKFLKTKTILIGCITSIRRYGLLVNTLGIRSLVHISKIPKLKRNLTNFYQVGDQISIQAVYVDYEEGRLALILNDS